MEKMEYTRLIAPDSKEYAGHEYSRMCENCGELNSVYTQDDNSPEYYIEVWVECRKCHAWIMFNLPVN